MRENSLSKEKWWPVAGVVPLATHDYPDHLSAVIFLQGCAWRCEYCHNPHLWTFRSQYDFSLEKFENFLRKRKGLLDAVVISGGEATLHFELPEIAQRIKSFGFKVGLHSGGANPHHFKDTLPYLDWVGFDFKTTWDRYEDLTKSRGSAERAQISLQQLIDSGVDYEVRSTIHPSWHPKEVLLEMADQLQELQVRKYILQEFRAEGCQSESLVRAAVPLDRLLTGDELRKMGQKFSSFEMRTTQGHVEFT